MKNIFLTLCKYEFKKILPTHRKGKKRDFTGYIISLFITLAIAGVFVFLLNIIAENYVDVKINKVRDPLARSAEFLNLLYTAIIIAMSIICLERIRKILSRNKEREIFLRLPVKPETIFLSKIAVLMIENYVMSLLLLVPANIVVYFMLEQGVIYWVYTFIVWLFLPIIPMFIAAILAIPYIKLIDFIIHKYSVMFVMVTSLLIGSFLIYSNLLSVVQSLLETGTIKFLFNENFIYFMQRLREITYPANLFTNISLGIELLYPLLIVMLFVIISFIFIYFITKQLFYSTLYRNDRRKLGISKTAKIKKLSPAMSLIKKEFISVFRDPGYMFSYFAIATAMPVMVYCCYTLFETLVYNAIGLSIDFSLALFIVLVFSVLTNTFCATNITRDGLSALTSKVFPVKPSRIMLSKVIFCMVVSLLSVAVSVIILVCATSLGILDGIVVAMLSGVFSVAQIFLATRLDLNHARVASGPVEAERVTSITVAKVIFVGLILSTSAGVCSLLMSMLSAVSNGFVVRVLSYLTPSFIVVVYLLISMTYYRRNIEKSFDSLVA